MKRFALASLFALTCAVPSSQAATIKIDITTLLEGNPVAGDSTVATLLFEDVAPNQVRLTVTSSLVDVDEFISDIAFNVALGFDPSAISASFVGGSQVGTFDLPTLTSSANGQNPPGPENIYDHRYQFATSGSDGGSHRFNLTDRFQYLFSANGLDALDFAVQNNQGFFAYSHVQGIGPTANFSSSYAAGSFARPDNPVVPEPTSLLLLASGLIAGARTLRKRS